MIKSADNDGTNIRTEIKKKVGTNSNNQKEPSWDIVEGEIGRSWNKFEEKHEEKVRTTPENKLGYIWDKVEIKLREKIKTNLGQR